MKKSVKIAIIVAVILIAVGIVLTGAVLLMTNFNFSRLEFGGNTNYTEHSFDAAAADVTSVRVSTVDHDIRFTASKDGSVHVVFHENDKHYYDISTENGLLRIEQKSHMKWYDYIGFDFSPDDADTVIALPASALYSLEAQTVSGEIELSGISAGAVVLDSTSGDIEAKNLTAEGEIALSSISGDISFSGTGTRISASSTSGEVELNGVADGALISTTSGDISASGQFQTLSASSTSGEIELERIQSDDIRLDTVSGEISGVVCGEETDYTIKINALSGDSRLRERSGGAKYLSVSTTSGDIDIIFSNQDPA